MRFRPQAGKSDEEGEEEEEEEEEGWGASLANRVMIAVRGVLRSFIGF